jgi:hypothetical protein
VGFRAPAKRMVMVMVMMIIFGNEVMVCEESNFVGNNTQ